ncbi:MAG: ABC transporter ATP-binding protein [Deltaproteobacteria bacterium]|nr:ABC transporter ATP-binding protein [Deltaproteobacteria bacterium]
MIEFRDVSKSFGGRPILTDVDIAVERGETLAIIGGSGTGKSVFLKHILGVLAPDQGHVLFEGRDVAMMTEAELIAMRRRIGMLFQGAALFDSLTVAENIRYPLLEHAHETEEKLQRIVAEKLRLVGLLGIEEMMPNDLSGGMKKRVGLARAIAINPDVILYDEPTAGLDPANTKRICRLIVELQEKLKVTSIVVTHDMESAFAITDRIALLSGGKFAFVGTASEARASINPLVQHFIEGDTESVMKREEP